MSPSPQLANRKLSSSLPRYIHTSLPFVLILIPILIFFLPLLSGKLPIPADTITGLYHPMRDVVSDQYPNGTPYKNFLITDPVRQQYPWRQFSIEQFKLGQIPWWNPYNLSGTPHLANFQSAAFYPLNIVFWLTSFTKGWTVLVVLQPILGAAFMYLYLKNKDLSILSSIFGSLVWIFSGFFVAWLEWNTVIHVALWTPLILLLFDKIITIPKPNTKLYPLLLLALASQFFAGHPQTWTYLTILQTGYLMLLVTQNKSVKKVVKIGVVILLSMSIFTIQLLPTLEYNNYSNRLYDQGDLLTKPDWFLPPQNLVQIVVPDFFGNPATLNYWGVFNYSEFVGFIGVIAFIFALSTIASKKSKTTAFFTTTLGIGLLMALRNPISKLPFILNIPLIGSSQPSRWLVIICLSLSILAAFGLNKYQKTQKKPHLATILTITILLLLWLTTFFPQRTTSQDFVANLSTSKRNLILPTLELAAFFLVVYCVPAIASLLKQKRLKNLIVPSLIIISTFSGVRFAKKYTSFSEPHFLYPNTQITKYLQENAGLNRYMTTDRRLMAPNFNLAYNLYTIEGYDPLYLKDYARLVYSSETERVPDQPKAYNRIVTTDAYNSPIVDILGVKYVLSLEELNHPKLELLLTEGETKLYQNNQVYPRSFLTKSQDAHSLQEFKATKITSYQPNQVIIQAQSDLEQYLVLTDAWYPNWQVTIDSKPAELINWSGLRATIIPEGNHEIIFKYRHPQL